MGTTTEDEMPGGHYQLDGHESEQVPGVGDGQGSLECCSPWVDKELDSTEQLNNNKKRQAFWALLFFSVCLIHNSNLSA